VIEVDTEESPLEFKLETKKSLYFQKLVHEDSLRNTGDTYLRIRVQSSNHKISHTRFYEGFGDFLGKVGGLTAQLAVFIRLMYGLYNNI
jgi:hypothetical protein